ncbi:MAG TPA: extracellular solute-binding protein [Chloroflexota bacterium]|nr:extracellular solute-binding protein [Chloroflexota bacterium]
MKEPPARPAPTRRAFVKGAALTFAGGLAVACAPGGGTAAERSARSTEPVTVEIWMESPNEEFKRYWDGTLLPQWKERYPQGTVELTWPGWAELETKLITANVGGSMPQLFRMGASFVPNAADSGLALALDDRVRQWGQRRDFFDGSWNTVVWRGKSWGLPQLTANRVWSYRKDLADEVGLRISDDWTWEQQTTLARQGTRGDAQRVERLGAFPVDVNTHEWQVMLYAAGGRLTRGGQPAFQGAEGQWALQQQIDRRTAVLPPGREPPAAPPQGSSHFAQGSTVMFYGNMNAAKVVQRFAPDKLATVTVPLPPTRTRRVSGSNTDWIAVGRSATAQDPAWDLLKLHVEPEALVAFNESVFFIPPRKSASEKAAYMQQPFMKRAVEILDRFGMAMPLVPSYARLNPLLEGEIRAAFGGEKSSAQALDAAARLWAPVLQEARWED